MNMKTIKAIAASAVMMAGGAFGTTLNVPSQYATIELALESANDGDVIALANDTYSLSTATALLDVSGEV